MKLSNGLVHNVFGRPQRNFAHVTTVTLSWRVQNSVVIGWVHFKPEFCKFWSNFEFFRNIVSGRGASRIRSVSDHRSVSKTPNYLPGARDRVPVCHTAARNQRCGTKRRWADHEYNIVIFCDALSTPLLPLNWRLHKYNNKPKHYLK